MSDTRGRRDIAEEHSQVMVSDHFLTCQEIEALSRLTKFFVA